MTSPKFHAFMIVCLLTSFSSADTLTITRSNRDNIEIPHFDTALGQLQSVSLLVTLQSGSTTQNGGHSHIPRTLTSTNTSSLIPTGGFGTFTMGSASEAPHNHTYTTPNYAAGGINIGTFTGNTNSAGSHSHQIRIEHLGPIQVGSNSWRLQARATPLAIGPHTHTVSSSSKSLNFGFTQLSPFLTGSDINIFAGSFNLGTEAAHDHSVNGFSRSVSTVFGSHTFNFAPHFTNLDGAHNHLFDPRFTTRTTFEFARIPEPSSFVIGIAGAAWMLTRRRRRV